MLKSFGALRGLNFFFRLNRKNSHSNQNLNDKIERKYTCHAEIMNNVVYVSFI